MTMTDRIAPSTLWYALSPPAVVEKLGTDADHGLSPDDVQRRIGEYGANVIATEPPPTLWDMAKGQLSNPMNIMLLIVSIASFVIGQIATGAVVLAAGAAERDHGDQPGTQSDGQRRSPRGASGPDRAGATV